MVAETQMLIGLIFLLPVLFATFAAISVVFGFLTYISKNLIWILIWLILLDPMRKMASGLLRALTRRHL